MTSASPILLKLTGERWKREFRSVVLWVVVPCMIGLSSTLFSRTPLTAVGFAILATVLALLIGVTLVLVFPLAHGAYQTVCLTTTDIVIAERTRSQTISLAALASVDIIQDQTAGRNRPAHYTARFWDTHQELLGTLNANAFEPTQLQALFAQLHTLSPELDLAACQAQLPRLLGDQGPRRSGVSQ